MTTIPAGNAARGALCLIAPALAAITLASSRPDSVGGSVIRTVGRALTPGTGLAAGITDAVGSGLALLAMTIVLCACAVAGTVLYAIQSYALGSGRAVAGGCAIATAALISASFLLIADESGRVALCVPLLLTCLLGWRACVSRQRSPALNAWADPWAAASGLGAILMGAMTILLFAVSAA